MPAPGTGATSAPDRTGTSASRSRDRPRPRPGRRYVHPPRGAPPPPKRGSARVVEEEDVEEIRPPRRRLWWGVAVGAVAVVVIVIVAALVLAAPGRVDVTTINYTSGDDVCNWAGYTSGGFTAPSRTSVEYTVLIYDENSGSSCYISTVTANTSGFSISNANTPVLIPVDSSANLSFEINLPSHGYTGNLTLDLE